MFIGPTVPVSSKSQEMPAPGICICLHPYRWI